MDCAPGCTSTPQLHSWLLEQYAESKVRRNLGQLPLPLVRKSLVSRLNLGLSFIPRGCGTPFNRAPQTRSTTAGLEEQKKVARRNLCGERLSLLVLLGGFAQRAGTVQAISNIAGS